MTRPVDGKGRVMWCVGVLLITVCSYHEATLDKDISSTPWEDDSTAFGASRELRFMKPVNLPGLTHARAKKVMTKAVVAFRVTKNCHGGSTV